MKKYKLYKGTNFEGQVLDSFHQPTPSILTALLLLPFVFILFFFFFYFLLLSSCLKFCQLEVV